MILVINHDPQETDAIVRAVNAVGHEATVVSDGQAWLTAPEHIEAHLIVIGQPIDRSALDMLSWVRDRTVAHLPIMYVTNESRRAEMAVALRAGADDAVVMPSNSDELVARLEVLLRHAYPARRSTSMKIEAGMYRIDVPNRWVWLNNTRISLTPREFDLAIMFFTYVDQLLTREMLLGRIWGGDRSEFTSHSLSSHVYRLKRKMQIEPRHGFYLKTYYSVGYRLETVISSDGRERHVAASMTDRAVSSGRFDHQDEVWSSGAPRRMKGD
ncbi:response regulator transcription factor [Burkholderia vietnamiensis]|uniref:response regulator transcription factor n=1 Tax=Burkholderia vietnamiensis TaxID=60552 RepID=UPI0009BA1232|nr:response regulator transcription factor [Burkholderia vietnamiensis]TPQ46851.1 DNA-binding response regulator [Burkholderia ubonensis]HDR9090129.1 response regulator transcription factor [Burkholderia vietnamiensis]